MRAYERLPLPAVGERLEIRLNVASACGDLLVIDVREGDRLGQSQEVLVAPLTLQSARDGGLIVLAALVPQLGEFARKLARPVTPGIALTTCGSLMCICVRAFGMGGMCWAA